jgi:hypothetical protein
VDDHAEVIAARHSSVPLAIYPDQPILKPRRAELMHFAVVGDRDLSVKAIIDPANQPDLSE